MTFRLTIVNFQDLSISTVHPEAALVEPVSGAGGGFVLLQLSYTTDASYLLHYRAEKLVH